MGFRNWWHHKSGKSKTLTVLCTVLILDIGLCFATPSAVAWISATFGRKNTDPFEAIGYMMIQARCCLILVVVIFCLSLFWKSASPSPPRNKENHDR